MPPANLAPDDAAEMHSRRLGRRLEQRLRPACVLARHDVHVLAVEREDARAAGRKGHGLLARDGVAPVRRRVGREEGVVLLRERVQQPCGGARGAARGALFHFLGRAAGADEEGRVGRAGAGRA